MSRKNKNRSFDILSGNNLTSPNETIEEEIIDSPVDEPEPEQEKEVVTTNDTPEEPVLSMLEKWVLDQVNVTELSVEELEQFISSENLDEVKLVKLEEAIKEHQVRSDKLDIAWTVEQCRQFIGNHTIPDTTSRGAWVTDINRKYRKAESWTTQELESWILGEIQPEGLVTDVQLSIELAQRLNLKPLSQTVEATKAAYTSYTSGIKITTVGEIPTVKSTPIENIEERKKEIIYAGLNEMNKTYIESSLARYLEEVKPGKPVSYEAGCRAQKLLDNVLRYVINLTEPAGVKSGLDLIREFIGKHRGKGGLFDDTHAFRFTDGLSVQNNTQESHIKLLTLFFIYVDENKEARHQYDVPSLVSLLPAVKQPLLLQYFSQL